MGKISHFRFLFSPPPPARRGGYTSTLAGKYFFPEHDTEVALGETRQYLSYADAVLFVEEF